MEMKELMERAKLQLADFTGLKPVTVTQVLRDDQGWHVTVDMLEMSRIPTATDVLGEYDVLLTEEGNVVRFQKRRSRLRGELTESEEKGVA